MDGLSAAASVIAVIQAIQMVASLCSQYLASAKNAKYDIQRLQGELQSLKTVFEGAQRLLEGPNGDKLDTSQSLRNTLRDCLSELEHLATKLKKRLETSKRNKLMGYLQLRLNWPLEGKDVDSIIHTFYKFRDGLCVCLNIDQMSFLLNSLERVDAMEQLNILDQISPVPYRKHHSMIQGARTPGTCEWILRDERFKGWEHHASSIILWLQGSLGTGKTFLTSRIIDHISASLGANPIQEGLAYFYFNRHETKRREPLYALRSWIRQLSVVAGIAEKIPKGLRNNRSKDMHRDSELNLQMCRGYLLELVNSYPRTTLVLDALDECNIDSRRELIEVVEFLCSKSHSPLRVFVSSRPDGDIRDLFKSQPSIKIEASDNQYDIGRFVNREITAHRRWGKMSPWLRKHILQVLIDRSGGMFQWAFLQIKQLLELLTEAAIMDRLGKLPLDLKATYDEIYGQISTRNGHDKAFADRAFTLVMCAPRVLNNMELLSAIRLHPDGNDLHMSEKIDEDLLLDLCNNLLVFDTDEKVWRFSHLSVMEYFEEHHYNLRQAHCHMAKVCLRLLIGDYKQPRRNILDESCVTRDCNDEANEIFHPRHPLQLYCRSHWIHHVQAQEGSNTDLGLVDLLKHFLGSPMESSLYFQDWFREITVDWNQSRISAFSYTLMDQISPPSISLFAVCRFSLAGFLTDWLDSEEIPPSLTNCLGDNLLTLAVLSDWTPTCEALIARGIPINPQDRRHISAVDPSHSARSSVDTVDVVTAQAKDQLAGFHLGHYGDALTAAAVEGYEKAAKCLLENGADVNSKRGPYGTVLAVASACGDIDIVEFLLKNGADVNLQHGAYGTALAAASACGNTDIVKLLLENDANINLQAGYYGTALAAAVEEHRFEVISLLIQRGADVNLRLHTGDIGSALAAAAASGNISTMEFLVKQGADLNTILHTEHDDDALAIAESINTHRPKFYPRGGMVTVRGPIRPLGSAERPWS